MTIAVRVVRADAPASSSTATIFLYIASEVQLQVLHQPSLSTKCTENWSEAREVEWPVPKVSSDQLLGSDEKES
jgi:hypothetical protein